VGGKVGRWVGGYVGRWVGRLFGNTKGETHPYNTKAGSENKPKSDIMIYLFLFVKKIISVADQFC